MTPLAQQTLARARSSVPEASATRIQLVRQVPPPPKPIPLPIAAAVSMPATQGPINRYQVMQGRQHAIDIAESAGTKLSTAHGIKEVIARLTRSTANKPASFAQGIHEIIEVLQKALP